MIFDQQLKITFRKSSGPLEKIHSPFFTHSPPKKSKSASPPLFANIENVSGLLPLQKGGHCDLMERYIKPERLGIDRNSPDADKTCKHWYRTFCSFVDSLPMPQSNTEGLSSGTLVNKFNLLISYTQSSVYEYISKCGSYEEAIETMQPVYVKPKNVILVQHVLST